MSTGMHQDAIKPVLQVRGLRTVIDGSAMVIGQAAAAFALLTGCTANIIRMRTSFDQFAPAKAA